MIESLFNMERDVRLRCSHSRRWDAVYPIIPALDPEDSRYRSKKVQVFGLCVASWCGTSCVSFPVRSVLPRIATSRGTGN